MMKMQKLQRLRDMVNSCSKKIPNHECDSFRRRIRNRAAQRSRPMPLSLGLKKQHISFREWNRLHGGVPSNQKFTSTFLGSRFTTDK